MLQDPTDAPDPMGSGASVVSARTGPGDDRGGPAAFAAPVRRGGRRVHRGRTGPDAISTGP